jgi:hypothetical protein
MRRLAIAILAASCACALAAQAVEVVSSEGYAESLVPDLGWRQAVIGRQLPEGAVVATWTGAKVVMDYSGDRMEFGSFGRLEIASIGTGELFLALTEGSLSIRSSSVRFVVEYRGARIAIAGGELTIADGAIAVASGSATVEGYSAAAVSLGPGSRLDLFRREAGPVLKDKTSGGYRR